jgi:hypothetical protein
MGMNRIADSYCTAELPAARTYYVHLGDTAGRQRAYAACGSARAAD